MKNLDTKKQSKKQGRIKHPIRTPQQWDDLCKHAVILREQGMSYNQLAQQLGCNASSLHTELKKRGLHKQFRSREDIRREKWDDLCQKAVPLQEKGMTYPEIAKHLSCHVTNLRQELKKRGLWKGFSADQLRMQRAEKRKERWDTLCEQAVILHEQGMSYTNIGRKLDCPRAKLEVELKKRGLWNGISIEQRKEIARKRWDTLCEQATILRNKQKISYKQIAKQLCCSDSVLVNELVKRKMWQGKSAERIQKKWDGFCKQAVVLREQGMSYKHIAKQLGYNETTLIRKMKKRGLWQGFSREQIKGNVWKRWDKLCEQAVVLRREQRLSYWKISLQLGCDSTMLGKELKKRGLYRKFHKDIKQDDYI
ncbi:TPA: hypothetical protein QCS32_004498 [Bacillus thuringiensis]|nr:hypothetical protein [Bacillus thuringiensis]MEB9620252.1 hypothetical protein [Bacillus cereus]HDR5352767.1 hypothetical protein [Bacillus thuringiensis]